MHCKLGKKINSQSRLPNSYMIALPVASRSQDSPRLPQAQLWNKSRPVQHVPMEHRQANNLVLNIGYRSGRILSGIGMVWAIFCRCCQRY